MKDLKDKINETSVNEERFAYTWQNAFICAIKSIDDKKNAKAIIEKWFDDENSKRELSVFLYRLGHEPKSTSSDDLYASIEEISIDNKFNLK